LLRATPAQVDNARATAPQGAGQPGPASGAADRGVPERGHAAGRISAPSRRTGTERQGLEQQGQHLEGQATRQLDIAAQIQGAEDFCRRVQAGLASASFAQRRQLVELLIDRVVVTDATVEIRYVVPTSSRREHTRFCHLRCGCWRIRREGQGCARSRSPSPTGSPHAWRCCAVAAIVEEDQGPARYGRCCDGGTDASFRRLHAHAKLAPHRSLSPHSAGAEGRLPLAPYRSERASYPAAGAAPAFASNDWTGPCQRALSRVSSPQRPPV